MTRVRLCLTVLVASVATILVACSGSGSRPSENWTTGKTVYRPDQTSKPNEARITREEFGEAWPFSVDEGVIAFEQTGGPGVGAVTFAAGGKTYGINGIARGKKFGHADVAEIWADAGPGLKKDLGPVVARGLQLGR